jgi:hypothetical protein
LVYGLRKNTPGGSGVIQNGFFDALVYLEGGLAIKKKGGFNAGTR